MSDYGDALVAEQKKQQAAAAANNGQSTPVPTGGNGSPYGEYLTKMPVVSAGGDDYSKFLQTMANNHKVENTPTNAKTYVDYLVYTGQDPVGDYNAKRRQADLDYRKSLATFGQNAEKLAQAGMTGSGYSDYLTGQAYAQRANTMQTAQRDANTQMKQGFANYGEYVAGLQAQQEQNTALDSTELTNAINSVSTMIGNGASIDAAIAGLKGVYSDAVLAQVKQNYQSQSGQQNTDIINSATGVSNYKAGLDQQLATGAITQDAYNQQLQAGYNKNYEFVTKALNGDWSGITEYASAAGLDVSAMSAEQLNAVIDHMAKAGAITNAQRQEFYYTKRLNSINDTAYGSKNAVTEAENINTLYSDGKITHMQKAQLLQALGQKVKDQHGEVTDINAQSKAKMDGEWYIKIAYKQGKYGNEKIQIDMADADIVEATDFVAGKSVVAGAYIITFGTSNGKLTYQVKRTDHQGKEQITYYQAENGKTSEYLNSKHNAAFMAYMMYP